MEHHLEKIHNKKHFFLKSFIVSVVLLIIVGLVGLLCFNFCAQMAENIYGLDTDDFAKIYVMFFAFWKLLIIQFTLVPAIVMVLIEKHIKQKDLSE